MNRKMTTWEGVPMTSWESTKFSLWLQTQDRTINTYYKEERIKIITDWLSAFRKEHGNNGEPVFLK